MAVRSLCMCVQMLGSQGKKGGRGGVWGVLAEYCERGNVKE